MTLKFLLRQPARSSPLYAVVRSFLLHGQRNLWALDTPVREVRQLNWPDKRVVATPLEFPESTRSGRDWSLDE